MPARFHAVTPLPPAGLSLQQALAVYVGQLGFQLAWRHGDMAGIPRVAAIQLTIATPLTYYRWRPAAEESYK